MAKNDNITTEKVYDLVDRKVSEINTSIKRLEDKFDNVQSKVDNVEGRMMLFPTLIASAISGFFFIMDWILNKK